MNARLAAYLEAAMGKDRRSVLQQQAVRVPGKKGGTGSRQVVNANGLYRGER
jgi:hypothetical protein